MRTLVMKILLGAAAFSSAASAAALGELDAAFGNAGRVKVVDSAYGAGLAQQPDGKIVVAGYTFTDDGNDDFLVARLNPDGTIDQQFGGDGVVTVDFAGSTDDASDVIVQPDGRIVVAGSAYLGPGRSIALALIRLNPDGTLDPTFDADGRVTLELRGSAASAQRVLLEGDGKLVAATSMWNGAGTDVAFVRFDATGALDTTFGSGGVAVVDGGHYEWMSDLVRQPDGKFVACGNTDTNGWDPDGQMFAVRVDANGSVDTTFATGGVWRRGPVPTQAGATYAYSCVAMPDGSLIVAGQYELVRLKSNGTLDTLSWPGGIVGIPHAAGRGFISAIGLLSDDRLGVVGSYVPNALGNYFPGDMFIASLDARTGALDTSFGERGLTVIDFRSDEGFALSGASGLVQRPDGGVVILGSSSARIVLARVRPDRLGSPGVAGFLEPAVTVSEGNRQFAFHVRRSGGSAGPLQIEYRSVAGSAIDPGDFAAVNGTLTWQDGETGSKTVTVTVNDDSVKEDDEEFRIVLSSASVLAGQADLAIRITDNETVIVSPPPPPPTPSSPASSGGGGAIGSAWIVALLGFAIARGRRVAHSFTPKPAS